MTEILFLIYIKSTTLIISQDIITLPVNFFIDCTNQDYKDISRFIYATDFELRIVTVANLKDRINFEVVGIRKTEYLLADYISGRLERFLC